jgi:nitric-oxide synthase, bacterial
MDTRDISAEAKSWLRLFCSETGFREHFDDRWSVIQSEIAASGSYWQTFDEIEYGSKVAWRNSTRCVGRLMASAKTGSTGSILSEGVSPNTRR